MRPPRVTHAGYMDFQYKFANTATPSFPMDYLVGKKRADNLKNVIKTLIKFQTVGYKSKNNTYN